MRIFINASDEYFKTNRVKKQMHLGKRFTFFKKTGIISVMNSFEKQNNNNIEQESRKLIYDVAVSDFDGTLARSDKTISQKTLEQIREYQKAGGVFALCTGRMTSATLPICRKYDLCDYAISFQGAAINEVKSGKSLYFNPVDFEVAARLADYAKQTGRNMQIYAGESFISLRRDELTDSYAAVGGITYESDYDLVDFLRKTRASTGKVLFHVGKENAPDLRDEIAKIVGSEYDVFISNPMQIDVVRAGVSKADGIKRLLKLIGRENSKIICFGDSDNDIPMLKLADFAVAPQNAEQSVKNIADAICESNDEGGVGSALERFSYAKND